MRARRLSSASQEKGRRDSMKIRSKCKQVRFKIPAGLCFSLFRRWSVRALLLESGFPFVASSVVLNRQFAQPIVCERDPLYASNEVKCEVHFLLVLCVALYNSQVRSRYHVLSPAHTHSPFTTGQKAIEGITGRWVLWEIQHI